MASLLMLLVVAVGAKGDVASPLEFQFQNTVGWNHLGTSVYAGNNLTVAYNGSHTHVLDASTLPKGMEVQDAGYWAWQLVEITNGGPSARDGHAMASLGDGRLLMYGGSDNDYTCVANGNSTPSIRDYVLANSDALGLVKGFVVDHDSKLLVHSVITLTLKGEMCTYEHDVVALPKTIHSHFEDQ